MRLDGHLAVVFFYAFVGWTGTVLADDALVFFQSDDAQTSLPANIVLRSDFPTAEGSLELLVCPSALPSAACEIFQLTNVLNARLVFRFVPTGLRWTFELQSRGGAKLELSAWRDEIRIGATNHLLLTWNNFEKTWALCVNGKWLRSAELNAPLPSFSGLALAGHVGMEIKRIALYRRCLSTAAARLLAEFSGAAAERLIKLAELMKEEDKAKQARHALVTRLDGKVGRIFHTRGRKPEKIPLAEGVVAEGIRPEDIGIIDLTRFAVLYFPMGPHFQIETNQYETIRAYVREGGGYVGDCQGAFFAAKLELLPVTCYANNIWGLYKIRLMPHFVTDFCSDEITMHFGNGPILAAGDGCQVIGQYVMTLPGKVTPAAIVAGKYGAGRVVIFGPHPLGEKVAFKGTSAYFSGKLLGTERLLINALLYAAKLADDDCAGHAE